MDSNKFLIIGANGQLGIALRTKYPDAKCVDSTELDITDVHAVEEYDWSGITHILNAAAYTNVDGAETDEGRVAAWNVNARAVANLSRIASIYNLTLLHISSDYVFDGRTAIHDEDELFSPLSVYGASKAAGDVAAQLTPKHYILRTTWVIGEGKNFVRTMLDLARRGIEPTVVADQIGRLTFTSELVRAIDYLLTNDTPCGVYNVTNDGPVMSWADITREIFRLSGYDNLTVTDTTTAEYFKGKDHIAPRPLNSEMNLTKLHETGFSSNNWLEDLAAYVADET